jgi:hypothetical protein
MSTGDQSSRWACPLLTQEQINHVLKLTDFSFAVNPSSAFRPVLKLIFKFRAWEAG